MWREAYQRRGCSLTFAEYVWHERRKLNKFAYGGTKVDISCVAGPPSYAQARGRKLDRRIIQAIVTNDRDAFDYPARYGIEHPEISDILCYNPTFTGQARAGELVEAAGWEEETCGGRRRLVVGTSREAAGEYLKVLRQ
jgi:predicted nucleotidyltransferase